MDPVSLRCFVAAAHLDSFRQAADHVGLSPAAFSDRIQRLEEEVGVELFSRTGRRTVLLPAGERLLPLADAALRALERCRDVGAPGPQAYTLTLGTRFELGMSWLVPSLTGLATRRPERTVQLGFGAGDDLMQRLIRGELDAIVTSSRLTDPRVDYATLHREDYVFVGAPALVGSRVIRGGDDVLSDTLLDTAAHQPLFGYVRDATQPDEVWRFASVELLGTIAAVRYRALEGAGLAVLPTYFVQRDLDDGALVRVSPEGPILSDAFRLVWRSSGAHEARMQALADDLRAIPLQ